MGFLRTRMRECLIFTGIALLILGGLTWATNAALRVEKSQRRASWNNAQLEKTYESNRLYAERLRQALWRLDSRLAPSLAREESRPYSQYFTIHSPFPALSSDGKACEPGKFFLPSPLLSSELPNWMSMHFQVDPAKGWSSPQVISPKMATSLRQQPLELALHNVTASKQEQLCVLAEKYPYPQLHRILTQKKIIPTEDQPVLEYPPQELMLSNSRDELPNQSPELSNRNQLPYDFTSRSIAISKGRREGRWTYNYYEMDNNLDLQEVGDPFKERQFQMVQVLLGPLKPVWLPSPEQPEDLLLVRAVSVAGRIRYQGIRIDWPQLQQSLAKDIQDLFPNAKLLPGEFPPTRPEQSLISFPIILETGEAFDVPQLQQHDAHLPPVGWTGLRIGLASAWAAAVLALLAIGLMGFTLVDIAERRIRFVSAVTHELRTPLTTLQLYLDMLNSGMIQNEQIRKEYLSILANESERLHRLVNNVLDFARLEKTAPAVVKSCATIEEWMASIEQSWYERCQSAGKELCLFTETSKQHWITTDHTLLHQVVSNLIDNAQKYTRDAANRLIAVTINSTILATTIRVEDGGSGIQKSETKGIFRAFRRGSTADTQAGGVGLGLALATKWVRLLGGKITLTQSKTLGGACFQVVVPNLQNEQFAD
ncbi:MAG: HAMP domain-containing sensor histidine kinase [Zavarzinella sp.]